MSYAAFDIDALVASCMECLSEGDARRAVRETLQRALQRPSEIADHLRPEAAGISMLYHSVGLTIIHVVWAPGMQIYPHDHRMWAVIAVYAGREDNEFFRREGGTLAASHRRTLDTGDVMVLGENAVHAVSNPDIAPTGAIHVYGGDFVNQPRSQWVPPELTEEPYDVTQVAGVFAAANAAWRN
jgi:predicted metal-dependent enzyme (double-stranded beta helix superfamily)